MYSHATKDEKIETISKTKLCPVSRVNSKPSEYLRDDGHKERVFDSSCFEEVL